MYKVLKSYKMLYFFCVEISFHSHLSIRWGREGKKEYRRECSTNAFTLFH